MQNLLLKNMILLSFLPAKSLLAGLMYHKPEDHIAYLEECLAKARTSMDNNYDWNFFHKGEDGVSLASNILSEIGKDAQSSPLRNIEDETVSHSEGNKSNKEKLQEVTARPVLFVLG